MGAGGRLNASDTTTSRASKRWSWDGRPPVAPLHKYVASVDEDGYLGGRDSPTSGQFPLSARKRTGKPKYKPKEEHVQAVAGVAAGNGRESPGRVALKLSFRRSRDRSELVISMPPGATVEDSGRGSE